MRKLFFIFVTVIGFLQIPMQSINAQSMKKEEVPQNISADLLTFIAKKCTIKTVRDSIQYIKNRKNIDI